MIKLLEDEKVAKLVKKETTKAVKAERKRILDGVKDLKVELASELEDAKAKKAVNGAISTINKVVRDAA